LIVSTHPVADRTGDRSRALEEGAAGRRGRSADAAVPGM